MNRLPVRLPCLPAWNGLLLEYAVRGIGAGLEIGVWLQCHVAMLWLRCCVVVKP